MACSLWNRDEWQPQEEELKYLAISFISSGKMEHELDRWADSMSSVMQALNKAIMSLI